MSNTYKRYLALITLLIAAGFGTSLTVANEPAEEAPAEDEGWEVLFDGSNTDAFRSWKRDDFPKSGWIIEEDGSLHAQDRSHDIITRKQYTDFDLRMEWKTSKGANSGIMYRVSEKGGAPHSTGPEYQIIDDNRIHKSSTASLYGMITPSGKAKLNPAGHWNSTQIVLHDNQVQHYLNGELVVEYVWGSDEVKALIAKSKFRDWDGFMQQETGHIAIQSHGKDLWFRNIKIKDLSEE
jgi:hypothetical protein